MFKPKRADELTNSILYMYNNHDKSEIMGARAKTDYFNNFSKEKHIKKALEIFEEIEKFI